MVYIIVWMHAHPVILKLSCGILYNTSGRRTLTMCFRTLLLFIEVRYVSIFILLILKHLLLLVSEVAISSPTTVVVLDGGPRQKLRVVCLLYLLVLFLSFNSSVHGLPLDRTQPIE